MVHAGHQRRNKRLGSGPEGHVRWRAEEAGNPTISGLWGGRERYSFLFSTDFALLHEDGLIGHINYLKMLLLPKPNSTREALNGREACQKCLFCFEWHHGSSTLNEK